MDMIEFEVRLKFQIEIKLIPARTSNLKTTVFLRIDRHAGIT